MKKIIVWLLYLLPVVFFAICYFLLTATEEDIAQGAGTAPDVLNDLIAAFWNNARLADMYAWAVINFFDYQYSFGVDTIFRLIDVIAVVGVLVLIASFVLGRRPKARLEDALVFMGGFLLLALTPYGYTIYRGFSMVHNYLIIALAMMGFCLPFARKLAGKKVPKLYKKWWVAVPMGLVFGLSSNFPPLAFLATYAVMKIWQIWQVRKQGRNYTKIRPEMWEILMIGGMLISMGVGYIFGPGVSGYARDPMYITTYDYVTVGDILQNFGGSMIRILKHMVSNFARTLAPIMVMLIVGVMLAWIRAKRTKQKLELWPKEKGVRRMIAGLVIFSVFVVLAGSQIIMPVRLCLPAELALIAVSMMLLRVWWRGLGVKTMEIIGGLMIVVAVGLIVVKTVFAWDFRNKIKRALIMVREAEEEVVCIDPNEFQQSPKMPFNMLQQEETFVMRQENGYDLYGKDVKYCLTRE